MKISVQYFAILREQRGLSNEEIETSAETASELYRSLSDDHSFSLDTVAMKVVINEEFVEWSQCLCDGDEIVFIPPVAGG